MSKGSERRPGQNYAEGWDRTFGNKEKPVEKLEGKFKSLYDVTGNIVDLNTLLVPVEFIRSLEKVNKVNLLADKK